MDLKILGDIIKDINYWCGLERWQSILLPFSLGEGMVNRLGCSVAIS